MGATIINLASVSIQDLKKGNRVQGTLTFKVEQHIEEVDPRQGRAMEVKCRVPERTVLSVAVLTVESIDRSLMPALVGVRTSTCLRSAHRKKVG